MKRYLGVFGVGMMLSGAIHDHDMYAVVKCDQLDQSPIFIYIEMIMTPSNWASEKSMLNPAGEQPFFT